MLFFYHLVIIGSVIRLTCYFLQLEEFMRENFSNLDLPPQQDTVFEYLVNENGEWEHWDQRVNYEI